MDADEYRTNFTPVPAGPPNCPAPAPFHEPLNNTAKPATRFKITTVWVVYMEGGSTRDTTSTLAVRYRELYWLVFPHRMYSFQDICVSFVLIAHDQSVIASAKTIRPDPNPGKPVCFIAALPVLSVSYPLNTG